MSLKNEKDNTKTLKKERADLMEKVRILKQQVESSDNKGASITIAAPAPPAPGAGPS